MSSVPLEKVTSIDSPAREVGDDGWLPGCLARWAVQAAKSTSSTPSPAVARLGSVSDPIAGSVGPVPLLPPGVAHIDKVTVAGQMQYRYRFGVVPRE